MLLGLKCKENTRINPLNAELNPICHLLALLGAHPILHPSSIRVNINKNRDSRCVYKRLTHTRAKV